MENIYWIWLKKICELIMEKIKIIITGADGQVGTALQQSIIPEELECIALNHAQCDISSRQVLDKIFTEHKPDIVINTAAYTDVDSSESNRDLAYACNTQAMQYLAECCAEQQCLLIQLSTDYVFSGKKSTPYCENDKPDPINYYGQTKWQAEQIIQSTLSDYFILRCSGIFSSLRHNFVNSLLARAKKESIAKIVTDQITCPTSAKDIARVLWQMVIAYRSLNSPSGIYHYCSTPPVSWYEFGGHVLTCAQADPAIKVTEIKAITTAELNLPAARPAYSVLDCEKIKQHFSIKQANWQDDIDQVVRHLLESPSCI